MNDIVNSKRAFRFSCKKEEISIAERLLSHQGFSFEEESFCPEARHLNSEPFPLGRSLAAFFGLIYIQDRASMLPPLALNPPLGGSVLDMCASPGSKTGQLARMVGDEGFVLGNEPSSSRLMNLRRNLLTMGLLNTATSCRSAEELPFPDSSWDYILLDPPCSGWGTVEKNPHVKEMWSGEKTIPLVRLQKKLLREAARLLRPGGMMTYSTCTTNPEENAEQVHFAMDELGLIVDPLPEIPDFAFLENDNCPGTWNLNPIKGNNQGFFVACLRKPGRSAEPIPYTDDPAQTELLDNNTIRSLGINPEKLSVPLGVFGQTVYALPIRALATLPKKLRWQGIAVGKTGKNREIRLSPRLRFEGELPHVDFEAEAGIKQITALLNGQSLSAPSLPRECKYVLLRWEGLVLARLTLKNGRIIWSEN